MDICDPCSPTGSGSQKGSMLGSMLCSCRLVHLNNCNFEFVSDGIMEHVLELRPSAHLGSCFPGRRFWLSTPYLLLLRALPAPPLLGFPHNHCCPLPGVSVRWHRQGGVGWPSFSPCPSSSTSDSDGSWHGGPPPCGFGGSSHSFSKLQLMACLMGNMVG